MGTILNNYLGQVGNQNKKFFHVRATERRERNMIRWIRKASVIWLSEHEDIAVSFLEHLLYVLEEAKSINIDHVLKYVDPKVTSDVNALLLISYSIKEFSDALK